jgi:hypothetical protein
VQKKTWVCVSSNCFCNVYEQPSSLEQPCSIEGSGAAADAFYFGGAGGSYTNVPFFMAWPILPVGAGIHPELLRVPANQSCHQTARFYELPGAAMLGKNDASNGLQVVYYRDQKAGQKSITCGASSEKLPPVPFVHSSPSPTCPRRQRTL